jgi:hypothetical protein
MRKIVISSPNIKSRALKELANKLSEKVGYRVYRVHPDRVRNRRPVCFVQGLDKTAQFRAFQNAAVSAPGHVLSTSGIAELTSRLVVARKLTNSSEGKGIEIFSKDDPNPPRAPLYTEYIPKKKEFRVHVWNKEVFLVQEKRKKKSFENDRNTQVRNTANGYVFCRDGITEPDDLRPLAVAAVSSLGRSYGAVDIIWNEKQNKSFVLEVNSRPGMQGTTVELYADVILKGLK